MFSDRLEVGSPALLLLKLVKVTVVGSACLLRGHPKINMVPLNVHCKLRGGRESRGWPVDIKRGEGVQRVAGGR